MYGRRSIWQEIVYEFRSGNMVTRLIMVNVAVFVVFGLFRLFTFLFQADFIYAAVMEWLLLPADLLKLATRPWTLFTHMFLHGGLLHILFNMLVLFWFGRILREFLGNTKILPVFLYGGLAGAVLMIAAYNIFPVFSEVRSVATALGASAGVMAIVTGAATLVPDYTIRLLLIGPVKIKWVALAIIAIDLISISVSNSGGHIAHIGGAILGFVYIRQLQAGTDLARPWYWIEDRATELFTRRKKPRVVYTSKQKKQQKAKKQAAKKKQKEDKARQDKIDAILDKINESGYDSLTKEEKAFLFSASKEEE